MVGRFTLPSLPSVPQGFGLSDFLDTTPQVFYPPTRPSSRGGPTSSTSASCPSSPAPRRRQRPLSMGDARILFAQPSTLPLFNPAAHPHTNSPLDSSRGDRGLGLGIGGLDQAPSDPPSPLLSQSTIGGTPLSRSQHRRSQSAAPSVMPPLSLSSPTRPRGLAESRNSISSTSAASLPTLAEDGETRSPFRAAPSPLNEPLWVQASLRRTQTLPRGRRGGGGLQPLTLTSSSSSNHTMSTSTSSSSLATITASSHQRSNSSISFTAPRPSRTLLGHQSSNSVAFPEVPPSPSPVPVCASTSVSDIAAQATWSQEPFAPPNRQLSRSQSVTSPTRSLRERLRSLTTLDRGPQTPRLVASPQLGTPLAPSTPRSTRGTPGHGTPTGPAKVSTPGSSTPTSSSHHHYQMPQSPTPTRRRPAHLTHKSTHSLPDALLLIPESSRVSRASFSSTSSHSSHSNLSHSSHGSHTSHQSVSRPTTSRLRQPAQLTMPMELLSPLFSFTSRCHNLLEQQILSPLSTSPGSLVSDESCGSGTDTNSPTTSIEDLALGPAFDALRERELNRERERLSNEIPDLILCLPLTDDETRVAATELDQQYSEARHEEARRHSRDSRELAELRESTLRLSTSSLRMSGRSQSLRESTRSSLRESTRSNRSSRSQRDTQGYGTSHAHVHNLHSSTSSYQTRGHRDSIARDSIQHPTHGTRVVLSTHDQEHEDRFLDFDDI